MPRAFSLALILVGAMWLELLLQLYIILSQYGKHVMFSFCILSTSLALWNRVLKSVYHFIDSWLQIYNNSNAWRILIWSSLCVLAMVYNNNSYSIPSWVANLGVLPMERRKTAFQSWKKPILTFCFFYPVAVDTTSHSHSRIWHHSRGPLWSFVPFVPLLGVEFDFNRFPPPLCPWPPILLCTPSRLLLCFLSYLLFHFPPTLRALLPAKTGAKSLPPLPTLSLLVSLAL